MLGQFSPEAIFGFFLVFLRLGSALMLAPALGESMIPARIRLSFALLLSLVILPLVRDTLPAIPPDAMSLTLALLREMLIGVILGVATRLIMSALHVMGVVVAYQTGLGAAQVFDPVQGTQGAVVGSFLTLLGILVIFTTNLHHLLIAAMRDSYLLFPVGSVPDITDLTTMIIRIVSESFRLGVQMSAPFLVYGLVFNIGLGLISRLMPQLQVFFIAMPLNIALGFVVLFMVIGASMMWFADYFENTTSMFLR